MEQSKVAPIMAYFSGIEDPRSTINRKYPLVEVIAITILAVMSFAQGWEDIERYGKAKQAWMSKFLNIEGGDTSARCVLADVLPNEAERDRAMLHELGEGHQAEHQAGGNSNKWEDGEGEFQRERRGQSDSPGERVGNGEPACVRAGENGGEKQRNHGDSDTFGHDSAGRGHRDHRRDGVSVRNRQQDSQSEGRLSVFAEGEPRNAA